MSILLGIASLRWKLIDALDNFDSDLKGDNQVLSFALAASYSDLSNGEQLLSFVANYGQFELTLT